MKATGWLELLFSVRGIAVNKALAYAFALASFAASAQAADLSLDSVKGAIPDGPITWAGVTFYGTVDVGYAYIHNGAYPSGAVLSRRRLLRSSGPAYNHGDVSTSDQQRLCSSRMSASRSRSRFGGGFTCHRQARDAVQPEFPGSLGMRARACSGSAASRSLTRRRTATAAAAGRRSPTAPMAA